MKRILWLLVILSLLPAAVLVTRRVTAEGSDRRVSMVMDEQALQQQAESMGVDAFDLALRYRELGLEGIAVYEETPESLAAAGKIVAMRGQEFRAAMVAAGDQPPFMGGSVTLLGELQPGALSTALEKSRFEPDEYRWAGTTWYAFPGDVMSTLPLGPDRQRLSRYAEAGFDIAYRPRNHQLLGQVGEDFPLQANYLVHAGLEVVGQPDMLEQTVETSGRYLTGIIEGTEQSGMESIAGKVPTVRLLSFNQDYVNQRLRPADLIEKYLLAANERNVTLLYLRPYTEPQLGNMIANTESLLRGLRAALEAEGFEIGPLGTLHVDYRTNGWLRSASGIGIIAGLGLLALAFPAPWGALVSLAVLGLGLAAGGFDWDALALVAALVFPVIGYAHSRHRLPALGLATATSLAGAALLVAVGSDQASMTAISPFKGVAATLVVPPLLFVFHYALRFRRPAAWVRDFWGYPIRIGDVVLVVVAMIALALVILRRGNFPLIGASETELAFRSWLSDLFVRPRFKELLGHPLAVLGLGGAEWPAWIRGGLLTGGVIAQASILNSFSHYHTPLLVSLQRTLIALGLGLAIGLVLLPLSRTAVKIGRNWLSSAR